MDRTDPDEASRSWLREVIHTFVPLAGLLGRTRALGLAAEMSFWIFLSLLPLAAVAAFVAARLTLGDWSLVHSLLASVPADARGVVTRELGHVGAWNGRAMTPLGGALFLWFASTGVHSIFDAFEAQTGARRSWLSKRARAIGCCVLLSCACAVLALVGPVFAQGVAAIGGTLLPRVVPVLLGGALLYLLVAALFRVGLPEATRRSMPLAPGTLLVVLLQLALGLGYRLYVSTLGDGSAYLAGLAAVGVTMTALYLSSISVLVGLGLNQVLGRARASRVAHADAPHGGESAGPARARARARARAQRRKRARIAT
jgi:membrane protein